jgi:hypothetical protein
MWSLRVAHAAYQALKSLATHKTDRNNAKGLVHLGRTGFFKPVHVKSLPAHAVRSLIIARKKLVGQRVTLENQIRGLAVVFGVRWPRALSPAFIDQALRSSEGIDGRPLGHGARRADRRRAGGFGSRQADLMGSGPSARRDQEPSAVRVAMPCRMVLDSHNGSVARNSMSALLIRSGSLMTDGSSRQQATGAARRRAPEQPWSAPRSAPGLPPAAIHHDLGRGNGANALTRLAEQDCFTGQQPECRSESSARSQEATPALRPRTRRRLM